MRALPSFRAGLGTALVLARGRAEGIRLLDGDIAEQHAMAAFSFWAALFCLPAFLALRALEWMDEGLPAAPVHGITLDLLGFGVGWLGYALLSRSIAGVLGRAQLWPRFVTVWNWCNVLQYVVLVLATIPPALGLPDLISESVWLIAMGWALWLEWFATRVALEISGLQAAGLVFLDVMLGALIAIVTGYAT